MPPTRKTNRSTCPPMSAGAGAAASGGCCAPLGSACSATTAIRAAVGQSRSRGSCAVVGGARANLRTIGSVQRAEKWSLPPPARISQADFHGQASRGRDGAQPGNLAVPVHTASDATFLHACDHRPVAAKQESAGGGKEDETQHALAAQGQGAQQFADRQEQDGDPERGAVQCAGDGDDKGAQGNEQEDGEQVFPSSILSTGR